MEIILLLINYLYYSSCIQFDLEVPISKYSYIVRHCGLGFQHNEFWGNTIQLLIPVIVSLLRIRKIFQEAGSICSTLLFIFLMVLHKTILKYFNNFYLHKVFSFSYAQIFLSLSSLKCCSFQYFYSA